MSGLVEVEAGSSIYLSIVKGQFTQRFAEGTPGTTERTTAGDNPKKVWEKIYKSASGIVTALKTKEGDYGTQAIVVLTTQDENGEDVNINVQFPMLTASNSVGRYATTIIKHLPNINFDKELKIQPYSFPDSKDSSKTISGFSLFQDGEKVTPFYTLEEPNGMPEATSKKGPGGKVMWNWTAVTEFLLEAWEGQANVLAETQSNQPVPEGGPDELVDKSDLPF
jgi:hypothetical protein